MTVQIVNFVLYSHDGRQRKLPLELGRVNIITGSSKSGKSALSEIVNYCFGSGKCEIPAGPIRRKVSWYGIHLRIGEGEAFIARKCPKGGAQSSEECYVQVAARVEIPAASDLRQTTNVAGLLALLNGWCGIDANLHEPPAGQTRPPLSATARHALLFCLQPQDVIGQKTILFNGTTNSWVHQALKDTLPYFLGAVDDDHIRRRAELRRLNEQLRSLERQIREMHSLRGEGISKASSLLAQARDVGLSGRVADTWEGAVAALQEVAKTPLVAVDSSVADDVEGTESARLARERQELLSQQQRIREEIESIQSVETEERAYSVESNEQRARLSAIGIFEHSDASHSCPLCLQRVPEASHAPTAEEVSSDLARVSRQLDTVTRVAPQVENAVAELKQRLQTVRDRLVKNRVEEDAVRASDEKLRAMQDSSTRRALVLGKVILYVESLPDFPDTSELESKAASIRTRCEELESQLSDESVRERLDSILARLALRMSRWAKELDLEHADASLRLDAKNLTVVADTDEGPVPMSQMGSAENWVGYHLIAHLALHEWFTKKSRPVPRFLFLDQPSQVYFPPEQDRDGRLSSGRLEDRTAVIRMFMLVLEVVRELAPQMQVIITEHADIIEPWYQSSVQERWRDGVKLVPTDWPVAD
ncbi:hypothetical protein GCM10011487_69730 [Steroidobacter agaridevorans]|uniref:DUF3732 domain-containing protein n=1 Tax=Steroidobacter agaridevorans TaxID=2695856 RepID=A0A829YQB7_9GAMM|nr:DUF3732 domain-containing protein [Steroidobacter agaridevorans]GFE84973.1 hypothetical protein GCM10011487_69730 [Steroidobacter agaridevorans]